MVAEYGNAPTYNNIITLGEPVPKSSLKRRKPQPAAVPKKKVQTSHVESRGEEEEEEPKQANLIRRNKQAIGLDSLSYCGQEILPAQLRLGELLKEVVRCVCF